MHVLPGSQESRQSKPPTFKTPAGPDAFEVEARYTDMANASALVSWHAARLRYCAAWGSWLTYREGRWVREAKTGGREVEAAKATARRLVADSKASLHAAKATLREYERKVKAQGTDDDRSVTSRLDELRTAENIAEKATRTAKRAQSRDGVLAMLQLAESDPRIATEHTCFDCWAWKLNVANGTLDLQTGELLPHNREDLITKQAPVIYEPAAEAPLWEAFLARSQPDPAIREYLQRVAGYSATGSVREHVLHFHYGSGQNGKSVFLNTLMFVLGDYAHPAARNLLFRTKSEGHDTRFADLCGGRFVTCNEIEEGSRWAEGLIKDLVSDDKIKARRMREDPWSFVPTHKLHIAGNHKPAFGGDDDGIWRRVRLVGWDVSIPPSERDSKLEEKLRGEAPGILRWIVEGAARWFASGIGKDTVPPSILAATEEYRADSDTTGQFMRECLRLEANATAPVAEVREAYEAYCKIAGAYPVAGQRFNARLKAAGGTQEVTRVGAKSVKAWRGVRLL